ncbi:MAG: helix-turn-helix transcriptional regulator [Hungateiclostridium thermocellum]|nr:helix-turn-helix transcriptional regulator [Acetivibrio thermocellus]
MSFTIGETIRILRLERAITQERLAEQLKVSASAVSKWERGEAYPDITLVPKLAELIGVSTDKLFGIDQTAESTYYNNAYDKDDYYGLHLPVILYLF